MKTCNCQTLPEVFLGKSVKEIPALVSTLDLIETDGMKWIIHYKCSRCGQNWDEFYETKGHGEIPNVRKVN
jgi:hypothetical protein